MKRLRKVGVCLLVVWLLSACGVAAELQPAGQAGTATGAPADAPALSPQDIQATVDAQVRATLAAQQTPAVTMHPTAADSTSVASATGTAQTAEGTAAAPSTAIASATQSVVEAVPAVTGQVEEIPVATSQAVDEPCRSPAPASANVVPATQSTAAAKAPPAMLLILDSSGSMLADDGTGRRKIDTAKDALKALVDSLPEGAPVGLRVYGNEVPNTDKANGCKDTHLIMPIGPLDKAKMKTAVDSFEAKGWTPISTSLEQAAGDLPPEGERTIVLVSDGEETCDRDPCQAAQDLLAKGIDVKIETIGFQVEPVARQQLECIAKATGGEYRDVRNAADLAGTLKEYSARALKSYQTVGSVVRGGDSFNTAPLLQAGQYQDTLKADETLYYALDLREGQRLRTTATIVGQPDVGNVATLLSFGHLRLHNPDRTEAGHDYHQGVGKETASIALETKPIPRAGRYYLSLQLEADEGLRGREYKTELIVEFVGEGGKPCPPAEGQRAQAPGPVQGGDSFNTAPLLQAGQYQDTLKADETLYYALDLREGQRLRASASMEGQSDVSGVDSMLSFVYIRLHAPNRDEAGQDYEQGAGKVTKNVALETKPIPAAGRYYLSLQLKAGGASLRGRDFKTELKIEFVGGQ